MQQPINKFGNLKSLATMGLGVIAVFFVLCNLLNQQLLRHLRFDFTQQHIYTLSKGSRKILTEIKEPIVLRYYYSKSLARNYPFLQSYAARIEELLEQYSLASKGRVILRKVEIEPFSVEEDEALHYGLKGVPIDNDGAEIFFGLVATNSIGYKQKIVFFQPNREAYLEYDISQMLYQLMHPDPTVVGVMGTLPLSGQNASFPMYQGASKPWMIWEQLQQMFELRNYGSDIEEIAPEVKLLLLANPADLTERGAKAIDDFVMRGGNVLAFVDPVSETGALAAYANASSLENENLKKLLTSWGVNVTSEVVACREHSKSVRYQLEGRDYTSRYPLWMDIPKENFSQDLMTNELERITLATPGAISLRTDATTEVKPLITSGKDTMLIEASAVSRYRNNPRDLLQEFKPSEVEHWLAVRISGKVHSAFAEVDESNKLPSANTNIVLVADSDMLHDTFWVNVQDFLGYRVAVPTSGNGQFVQSALEYLSGSSALISIRNRGNFARPFTKIEQLQLNSEAKFREEEQKLIATLETARESLAELEKQAKDAKGGLNAEQRRSQEEGFRNQLVATRKQLREVRHELNKDISRLQYTLKFIGTGLLPLLITVFGLLLWAYKVRTPWRMPSRLYPKRNDF